MVGEERKRGSGGFLKLAEEKEERSVWTRAPPPFKTVAPTDIVVAIEFNSAQSLSLVLACALGSHSFRLAIYPASSPVQSPSTVCHPLQAVRHQLLLHCTAAATSKSRRSLAYTRFSLPRSHPPFHHHTFRPSTQCSPFHHSPLELGKSARYPMGVIDSSPLCLLKSNVSFNQFVAPNRHFSSSLFEGNQRSVIAMSSTIPLDQHVNQGHDHLTGNSFIRPYLRKLSPYQPILPFEVLSTQLGRKPEDIVKIDANENPYGPPPEVSEALGQLKFPYIYPDPESRQLRAALSKDSGLESNHILVGCGADELIDLIMRCVLDPGDKIVDCPPTFTMYEFDANVNGAVVVKVPRKSDFSLNVELIADAVEQENPKCIFLTSPNNPDGSVINDEDLLKILEMPILVVLDEAYIEFSGHKSRMKWVKKHDNLVVLRTFSKRAGLAGLRVGYGAFPLSIIEYIWRAKQPYNVSVAAEVAACAALQNPTYLENVKDMLIRERERLFKLMKEVPFLNPYPSYSNFILCEVTAGKDPKKLKDDLAQMGVMIRHYNNKELKGYVRVSVGKPEHTNALMECLKRLS